MVDTATSLDLARYILSVHQDKPIYTINHYRIVIQFGEYVKLEGAEKSFKDIGKLLEFYENNRISPAFKNIGQRYTEDEFAKSQWFCAIL